MLRLITIALFVTLSLCQLGGWKAIPTDSLPKEVSSAGIMGLCQEANFALSSFSSIQDVEQQIVAGYMYKFTTVFNFNNEAHKFQVRVWKKLDGSLKYLGSVEITHHEKQSLIGLVGGWSKISPKDVPEEIKEFGLKQISSRLYHTSLKFFEIESAKSQIVAGVNYDLVYVMKGENCEHKFRTVIFKGLQNSNEIVSLDEIYIKENDQLLGGFSPITEKELPEQVKSLGVMGLCKQNNFSVNNLVTIENIQRQTVAGFIYKFTLGMKVGEETHKFEVEVYQKVDNSSEFMGAKEITSHN